YIDRSISLWEDGDRSIDELIGVAEELHRRVQAGETDQATLDRVVAALFAVDERLTPKTDAFSASLGEATRATALLLTVANLALAGTLIPIALMLSRRMLARSDALEQAR